MRAVSLASSIARADGSREFHAYKPLGETPNTRHIVLTG
jgi:hypothetical protein